MAKIDRKYHELVNLILDEGYWYDDPYRKGVKRQEISTYTFTHNFKDGFPALTTKDLYWKGIVGELLWFLRGDTNIEYLIRNGINIWNKDVAKYYSKRHNLKEPISPENLVNHIKQGATNDGEAGRIYGAQWREWGLRKTYDRDTGDLTIMYVDQIQTLIDKMIKTPLATDLVVNAWDPYDKEDMALPPCHFGFQVLGRPLTYQERYDMMTQDQTDFYWKELDIINDNTGHKHFDNCAIPRHGFILVWDQRSVDTFLGLPFNIASYALLAHILGAITSMKPLGIQGNLRKVHIYDNAIPQIKKQLSRDTNAYSECGLRMSMGFVNRARKINDIDEILAEDLTRISDFELVNYESYPPIKAEMLARD